MGTGFRIFTRINRPDPSLVEAFRDLPVANIADEMNRFGCMDGRIKPLNATPLLGVALTVKAWTADNLLLHKAIDMALPGDIIVVDAQADVGTALIGEIMLRQAVKRRLGGLIIDGAVRDLAADPLGAHREYITRCRERALAVADRRRRCRRGGPEGAVGCVHGARPRRPDGRGAHGLSPI